MNRTRSTQPIVGTAVARPADMPVGGLRFVNTFGGWFPFYGSGFGYNLSYVSYDPWFYGNSRWIWGRYGLWYDPWALYPYDPFYYPGYYGGGYGGGYGYREDPEIAPAKGVTGSIRLRANVSSAKVYVDGTLVGTVDDFDGLTHHLDLEPGTHALELRADGYQSATKDVNVSAGKTTTERLSLKKK